MTKITLSRKRPAPISTKPAPFKSLTDLGTAIVEEVDQRLLSGDSPLSVSRWLHSKNLLTNTKVDSVRKMLDRYRETELTKAVVREVAGLAGGVVGLAKRLNAMEELTDLVSIQRGRLEKLLVRESQLPSGILLKDTTNEIRLTKDMLIDLGRLQLETGILPRASKTMKGKVIGADGETKTFEWTEEQDKMYREIEGFDLGEGTDIG